MIYEEVLREMQKCGFAEVREKLSAGEQKVIDNDLAILRVYQDQPASVPYMFRPKRYVLKPTDKFAVLFLESRR